MFVGFLSSIFSNLSIGHFFVLKKFFQTRKKHLQLNEKQSKDLFDFYYLSRNCSSSFRLAKRLLCILFSLELVVSNRLFPLSMPYLNMKRKTNPILKTKIYVHWISTIQMHLMKMKVIW